LDRAQTHQEVGLLEIGTEERTLLAKLYRKKRFAKRVRWEISLFGMTSSGVKNEIDRFVSWITSTVALFVDTAGGVTKKPKISPSPEFGVTLGDWEVPSLWDF